MHAVAISRRRQEQLERLMSERDQAIAKSEGAALKLRGAVTAARDEGASIAELQEILQVNRARIYQLLNRDET
jgi:imidazolonepropionase-like amidohydrolase